MLAKILNDTKCEVRRSFMTSVGDGRGAYRVLVEKPDGKNHFQDLGLDGRVMLKWTFKT
jgi:hypothetical protein